MTAPNQQHSATSCTVEQTGPDQQAAQGLLELLSIMRQLRDPDSGCPWDIEQTFASVAPYTIEEAYEVADTIERQDWQALPAELGDLLLQVVFHAQMAAEQQLFDLAGVCQAINAKLIRRHPHVFPQADTIAPSFTAAQQTQNWEQLKQQEREAAGQPSVLDDIPRNMPELTRALKLQKRAARVGFDWPHADAVLDKLTEELAELEQARNEESNARIEDELGDVLFVLVNLARKLDIDAAAALRHANAKFERRFRAIEQLAEQQQTPLSQLQLQQMEALWQQIKQTEPKAEGDPDQ